MKKMNTNMKNLDATSKIQLEWRRSKVLELSSQGYSQTEIAKELQLSIPTIHREIQQIKKESRSSLQEYFEQDLPTELRKTRILCDMIIKDAYNIIRDTTDDRTKTDALRLIHNVAISKKDLMLDIKAMDAVIDMTIQAKAKLNEVRHSATSPTITDTDTVTEDTDEETEEVD